MAIPGTTTTLDLTTGLRLDLEDMIWLNSPFDVPLLGTYGADGRTTLSSDTCFEKLVQWLDEDLLTPRSTVGATLVTAATDLIVTTGDRLKFQTGDVLLIDSEQILVTDYSATTADDLIVLRAYTGSAAQHSQGAVVVGVGTALVEGSNPSNARVKDRNLRTNQTQIFEEKVQVSGTENVVRKYGLPTNEFDYQAAQRTKEIAIDIESALLYGQRGVESTTQGRTMGGFAFYITTNVDSTSTVINEASLLPQIQNCFNAGGAPDRLTVSFKQKRIGVSQINQGAIRYGQMDNVRSQTVDFIDTDAGRVTVIIDRWLRDTDAFLFSRDQATVCVLRPLALQMLAQTGDALQGMVLCEKSLRFRRQTWASKFTGLT